MAGHDLQAVQAEPQERQPKAIAREAQNLTKWAPFRRCELVDGGAAPWLSTDGDHVRAGESPR